MTSISCLGRVLRIDVQVLEDDGLAEGGLVVDPAASVSVPAGSNLKLEAAVDFVLFCPKYRGEIFCHFQFYWKLEIGDERRSSSARTDI